MNRLTSDERKRLNALFSGLWDNRGGVKGSWGESSYRYHPTFIRRGALLLVGGTEFSTLWVIVPATANHAPINGDSRCSMSVFPKIIGGEAIAIHGDDDGPWWDTLRQELPLMEAELAESVARIQQREADKQRDIEANRRAVLDRARKALEGGRL